MNDVQAIADRFEIEALRGEFTDAIMVRDYDRFAALFTPVAVALAPVALLPAPVAVAVMPFAMLLTPVAVAASPLAALK